MNNPLPKTFQKPLSLSNILDSSLDHLAGQLVVHGRHQWRWLAAEDNWLHGYDNFGSGCSARDVCAGNFTAVAGAGIVDGVARGCVNAAFAVPLTARVR